jgi:DNA-binding MarR family transcriptional regulator
MGKQNKHDALKDLIVEVFQANGQLLAKGDQLSADMGLTGARWQVLGALHLEERALTVAQIARRMGLQRQSVQRLTDILVEQEILAYHPNPEHKRAKLVDFTAKGRQVFEQMDGIQQNWAEAITSDFTANELQQATTLLRRLREKLDC